MSQCAEALKHAKPCVCGSKNLVGHEVYVAVCCGDCGREGKLSDKRNWPEAVINWNTLPGIRGDKTETPPT